MLGGPGYLLFPLILPRIASVIDYGWLVETSTRATHVDKPLDTTNQIAIIFKPKLLPRLQPRSHPATPFLEAMSASTLPSLTERLPVELLERIFLFTPTQYILRLSLVRNIMEVPRIRAFAEYGNLKGQSRLP